MAGMGDPQFEITIPHFTGTVIELIDGIRNDVVDILDISLARITTSFLEYLGRYASLPIVHTVDVYFYTSQLLLFKSQCLAGKDDPIDSEELKEGVVEMLIEFQRLKKLSDELRKIQVADVRHIIRKDKAARILRHYKQSDRTHYPLVIRNTQELVVRARRVAERMIVIRALPKPMHFPLDIVHERLMRAIRVRAIELKELLEGDDERRAQLASALLVVLIAVRKQTVWVTQAMPFGTVSIRKR